MIELKQSLYRSERMFLTGDNPLLITCSDMTDWVCKHGRMSTSTLFNEIIGSRFAQLWSLKTPAISLIEVAVDHIPDIYLNTVQPAFFKKPCFGSLYIEYSQVIDNTLLPSFRNSAFKNKIANKLDFLKIALFDIWLSNEDRHHGNSNLLLDQTLPGEYYFTVFDHGAIFNSNTLHHDLYLISDNESIICSDVAQILFSHRNNLTQIVDNIVKDFYLYNTACEENLSSILTEIPLKWGLDISSLELLMRKNLFDSQWLIDCETHFRALIQANI